MTREIWVDVRWVCHDGRWIASADTADGPTLGVGWTAHEALTDALEPFDGVIIEGLLDTLSDGPPR